jgi:hypothetical protein
VIGTRTILDGSKNNLVVAGNLSPDAMLFFAHSNSLSESIWRSKLFA